MKTCVDIVALLLMLVATASCTKFDNPVPFYCCAVVTVIAFINLIRR